MISCAEALGESHPHGKSSMHCVMKATTMLAWDWGRETREDWMTGVVGMTVVTGMVVVARVTVVSFAMAVLR